MYKTKYFYLGLLVIGCSSTTGALLVHQNKQAASPLAINDNPSISGPAKDIVLNSDKLLETDYAGKLPDNPPVYTPSNSLEIRNQADQEKQAKESIFGLLNNVLGTIPGGGWLAALIPTGWALIERLRKNKYFKVAASTMQIIEEQGGDKLKESVMKEHIAEGVVTVAKMITKKLKPKVV
jgi:hypothetical protein